MSTSKNTLHLSIIIPAYNEAGNINKVIRDSLKEAKKITSSFEIIVCDDGSSDDTQKIIRKLQKSIPQLRLIINKRNLGMAPSLIRLFKKSRGEFIQTMAGDFQFRPKDIPKFYKAAQKADLVTGWRQNRKDPLYRLIISKIYNLCTRILFGVKIHDLGSTKMIRRDALRKINPQTKTNFIEAEIIIKAYQLGLRVAEVSISYHSRTRGRSTGAKPAAVIKTFIALFKYFLLGKA